MPVNPTSPLMWSKEQLDNLESPTLVDQVLKSKNKLENQYNALFPYLSEKYPQHFPQSESTLERWTWASLQTWGRSFDTSAFDKADPDRRTWTIIPFADLVNHESYVESFYNQVGDIRSKPASDIDWTVPTQQNTKTAHAGPD
eukprot:gene19099-22170_t